MNDRIYLRTNFSSATAYPGSGARQKNAYGEEYARIPMQLPSNLIDPSNPPNRIEMLLTKLNIPLGSVPIAQIPVDDVLQETIDGQIRTTILTKAWATIWPFRINTRGVVYPLDYPTSFYDPTVAQSASWTTWPKVHMIAPMKSQGGSLESIEDILKLRREGIYSFKSPEDFTAFLSYNLGSVFRDILHYKYHGTDDESIINKYAIDFSIENSRLHLKVRNYGALHEYLPFTNQIFNNVDNAPAAPPQQAVQLFENEQLTAQLIPAAYSGFSIVGNSYLRDMCPGLPWVEIDVSKLKPFDPTTGTGQSIYNWGVNGEGGSDPNHFYVLDTYLSNFSWGETEIYPHDDNTTVDDTKEWHTRPAQISFDNYNIISMVPVNAFVVMLNGLTITPQTYPVNLNPLNLASSQITSIPIIEVYNPLWNTIEDLSTNLIVSKDAFTNAAPFVLSPDALQMRNLTFEVYYVTNDGSLHLLTIPPSTSISLQICYSITY